MGRQSHWREVRRGHAGGSAGCLVKVTFTPAARQDLKSIRSYIAEKSYRDCADAYIARIVDYCNGLAVFPHRGTQYHEIPGAPRVVGFERRVTIAFTVSDEEVVIHAIAYGRREWANRTHNAFCSPVGPSLGYSGAVISQQSGELSLGGFALLLALIQARPQILYGLSPILDHGLRRFELSPQNLALIADLWCHRLFVWV